MRLNLPLMRLNLYQMMDCTNKVTLNAFIAGMFWCKQVFMAYSENTGHAKSIFRIHFCSAWAAQRFSLTNYVHMEIFLFK